MSVDADGASAEFVVRLSARAASTEDVLADLRETALRLDSTTLTREAYDRYGRFSSSMVVRRVGSWADACTRAGVQTGRPDLGHADDAWMQNIADRWTALGRQPSYGDMRESRFSPEGYAKRYGSWTDALRQFSSWVTSGSDDAAAEVVGSQDHLKPAPAARSRTPSLRLRSRVMQRDRFSCRACGASPSSDPSVVLHVDHVVPFTKGGDTVLDNLQTLCDRCNYGKSDTLEPSR